MIVRNLIHGDRVSSGLLLKTGFEQGLLTPDLVWVAVDNMQVVGIFIAFAAHGFFMPFRMVTLPTAPYGCVRRLAKKAFADALSRGYHFFLTALENVQPTDRQLLKLLELRGITGTKEGDMIWVGGNISDFLTYPKREALRRASGE